MSHTPGPWYCDGAAVYECAARDADYARPYRERLGFPPLAYAVTGYPGPPGTSHANARLICAAPDLLVALRALLNANTRHEATEPDWREALAQARVTLAKAADAC